MIKTILAALFAALGAYSQAALACHIRNPIELMRNIGLRGPIFTMARSASNQWAGLTTLASGSATQVVSTQSVNSDSLISLSVYSSMPAAYAVRGWASVAAGASTATQSTTAIYSGMAVDLTYVNGNNTGQASGQGRSFDVNSIVNGVSFALATQDRQNVTSGPINIGWRIPEAMHQGLKVNTIVSKGYFVVGWADGQSRPLDATVMWELRKTSAV